MAKKLLLGVALFLPVAIYLFLQSFGSNVYGLPRMYQDAVPEEVLSVCKNVTVPYTIRLDSYVNVVDRPIVFDVRFSDADNAFINNEVKRVSQYFKSTGFYHYVVTDNEDGINGVVNQIFVDDLNDFVRCELISLENASFMVLVDEKGIIRGLYNSYRKQEFDKLIVEIEILKEFK